MQPPAQEPPIEPRWHIALAIFAVVLILVFLPRRIMLFPAWFPYFLGSLVLAPMVGVSMATEKGRWLRLERTITLLFFLVTGTGTLMNLGNLIRAMIHRPEEISGMQLLTSSIGVWITNVLAFSLLYWQIDRGGPEARSSGAGKRPEWLFPQAGTQEQGQPEWRPQFIDYLFLSYSTSTAFSATDVAPLSARAKLLMMFESSISLLTILLVAARAVNILG